MPRKKKLVKKVGEKIEDVIPEKKKTKKVEISEIAQKIPQNARFGMVIAVAIFWVAVIQTGFMELFQYFDIPLSTFVSEFIIAVIITAIVYAVFKSWTKIARRVGKVKVKVEVKPRVKNHGNSKKRR